MTPMLFASILQAAILATGADPAAQTESYDEAHRTAVETGKPMVIMVGTTWCPPCQAMKKTILPRVREHGLFKRVAFATVDPDRDGELVQKLTGGGPVPQLVMFRHTPHGWMRKKLVGGQSVETVEQFINEGLAADEADKKAAEKGENTPSSDKTTGHNPESAGDDQPG
jgi:thioredoxin-like negative regulator of GroEL